VDLNIIRLRDDPASISRKPDYLRPEEGLLVSSNFRAPIHYNIYVTGEIGTSAFTRNMFSSDISEQSGPLTPFLRQRISTHADYAGELFLHTSYSDWGLKGGAKYISPGYVALGYPYLQSDRLEFLLSPRVHLFERRLNLDASIGHRSDNLLGTRGTKTTQLISSVNIYTIPTDALSISIAYSNFGIRNNQAFDTLRIQNVAQSFSISPSYTIPTESIQHLFSASVAFDTYDEYNTVTRSTRGNRTQSIVAAYYASFLRVPINANLSFQHFRNDAVSFGTEINSVSLGGSYRFTDLKLVPSCALTYATSEIAAMRNESQWNLRIGATWSLEQVRLSLQAQRNMVDQENARGEFGKTETYIQISMTYSF
jgi:hypothetical protein